MQYRMGVCTGMALNVTDLWDHSNPDIVWVCEYSWLNGDEIQDVIFCAADTPKQCVDMFCEEFECTCDTVNPYAVGEIENLDNFGYEVVCSGCDLFISPYVKNQKRFKLYPPIFGDL